MARAVWFVVGTAAGAYGVTKARRTAEALTYDGLTDRLNGVWAGAAVWRAEVREHARRRELRIRSRLAELDNPNQARALAETTVPTTPHLSTPALDLPPGLTLVKRTDT